MTHSVAIAVLVSHAVEVTLGPEPTPAVAGFDSSGKVSNFTGKVNNCTGKVSSFTGKVNSFT